MVATAAVCVSDRIIIRLLNGALSGCEFFLSPGRTLFIVGNISDITTNSDIPDLPNDTIFVPSEQGGVNFEVLFDKTEMHNILLRELLAEGSQQHERTVSFNDVQRVGALDIAFRSEHQLWSQEILVGKGVKNQVRWKRHNIVFFPFLLAILALLIVGGGYLNNKFNKTSVLFDGESERFQIIREKDGTSYIYARTETDTAWAQQYIRRVGYTNSVKVINESQESERISYWLASQYPSLAYYRLSLGTDPLRPKLWISSQRSSLSKDSARMLGEGLAAILPYADRVDIVSIDDTIAVSQAEAQLQRQALVYTRRDLVDSVIFVIQGSLTDEELLRIRFLVDDYYSQWGKRYVQFTVELRDDPFKGAYFQYGDQSYVKIKPGSWYFQSLK
ncbi:PrgH/EprH family type III secretion apparatus protein [Yokenella regensburgei]|uniref:PrgH/EprH family type III secretion apparatus protein n=1 Tax=Yokenella regensburgei TaxID=158877 RepID=UPI001432CF1B|nr:PrgH/EprH family type III secretion apparatus protein [Yokenella regensburgei]QIU92602.1 PrgH/EprH family type III secretion apparatus protein [Yokenella regensburgei]